MVVIVSISNVIPIRVLLLVANAHGIMINTRIAIDTAYHSYISTTTILSATICDTDMIIVQVDLKKLVNGGYRDAKNSIFEHIQPNANANILIVNTHLHLHVIARYDMTCIIMSTAVTVTVRATAVGNANMLWMNVMIMIDMSM
jgi:hypothetical protein